MVYTTFIVYVIIFSMKKVSLAGVFASVFLFILPFVFSKSLFYGSVNAKYFFAIAGISFLSFYFCYKVLVEKHQISSFKNRWLLLTGAGFFVVLYLTSFTGIFAERSFYGDILRSTGVLFLSYVGFLAFLASELFTKSDWLLIRRSIAFSGAVFALATFFELDTFFFGNTTFVGSFLFLSVTLTWIELFNSKNPKTRIFFGILLGIQMFSPTLFSFSEFLGEARASSASVWGLTLYSLGLWFLNKFKKENFSLAWNGLWILAIIIPVSLLFIPGSFIQKEYIKQSTSARIIVWESGLEAFREKPLLGWGPENFRTAFVRHFDNNLYLEDNIGEVWFDRAHNVFVDGLVAFGLIGVLVTTILLIIFGQVLYLSKINNFTNFFETNLLGALMVGHILQLQTSFNTSLTYIILAVVIGYGLWLERQMSPVQEVVDLKVGKIIAGILLVFILIGSYYMFIREYQRQSALFNIFRSRTLDEQIENINISLDRTSDFEGLRLTSSSLINGLFGQLEGLKESDKISSLVNAGIRQMLVYEDYYIAYLNEQPNDYRARMNYAYLLLNETILGKDRRIKEAQEIIESSYKLSPNNPLTYALDAVASFYSGNITEAEVKIEAGLALNPEVEFTHNVKAYIEQQKQQFPNITVIKMENL